MLMAVINTTGISSATAQITSAGGSGCVCVYVIYFKEFLWVKETGKVIQSGKLHENCNKASKKRKCGEMCYS